MINEIHVIERISQIAIILKENQEKKRDKVPFHATYDVSVEHARDLSVHAHGEFPFNLIVESHPNETQEEFEYRKDNYQAVTMPSWTKALKTVNRIWNRNNFSVKYKEDDKRYKDYPAHTYFEKDYPTYQTLLKYFQSVVTDFTFSDPNSLLVVKPKRLPMVQDDDGNLKHDQSQLIDPVALIYSSKDVLKHVEDEYAIFMTSEHTNLHDNKAGIVMEMYDKEAIYRIEQYGKKEDFTFRWSVYYEHCLGVLPVLKLSGIYTQMGQTAYLKSYFNPALPNLNLAAISSSTLFMSEQAHAFPQRWEMTQRCHNEGCFNGYIDVPSAKDSTQMRKVECPSCKGTGTARPLKTKEIMIPDALEDNSTFTSIPTPPMGYVSPPESILEFSQKRIETNINQAFTFVGIDVSTSQPKAGEVALSKMIDREETFAFLLKISNDLFPLYEKTINLIGMMRYSVCDANGLQDYWKKPEVTYPVDFTIKTESEIVQEIKEGKDAGIDKSALIVLNKIYSTKRFNPSGESETITNIIYYSDSLVTMTNVEINSNLSIGRINLWEAVLHQKVNIYIEQLILDDRDWLNKDINDQKAELIALAQAEAQLLPFNNVGTTQSILGGGS